MSTTAMSTATGCHKRLLPASAPSPASSASLCRRGRGPPTRLHAPGTNCRFSSAPHACRPPPGPLDDTLFAGGALSEHAHTPSGSTDAWSVSSSALRRLQHSGGSSSSGNSHPAALPLLPRPPPTGNTGDAAACVGMLAQERMKRTPPSLVPVLLQQRNLCLSSIPTIVPSTRSYWLPPQRARLDGYLVGTPECCVISSFLCMHTADDSLLLSYLLLIILVGNDERRNVPRNNPPKLTLGSFACSQKRRAYSPHPTPPAPTSHPVSDDRGFTALATGVSSESSFAPPAGGYCGPSRRRLPRAGDDARGQDVGDADLRHGGIALRAASADDTAVGLIFVAVAALPSPSAIGSSVTVSQRPVLVIRARRLAAVVKDRAG
ncbi:hypothetical protein HMN09_00659700 [Mycena chlorophos]|uniref:Uncharacterized protein n=1 Tax=Mycena chlorophos TaxID=658473 RepID=A0A8H6T0G4_MYCCL|nr:hypothetical protein HMN09_00659700 [Mycena chlorophos]